tara:strand:+ start:6100 stop:6822 length:723 start_codon:yes stop_codon:yes gene_type:complete
MKILIAGDSWGCGEWSVDEPRDTDCIYFGKFTSIAHKGLEQYLLDDGHSVTNLSIPGGTFRTTLESLQLENGTYDAKFVFVTDAFRGVTKHHDVPAFRYKHNWFWTPEHSPQFYKDLYQRNIREFVDTLSHLKASRGPIYLIGGLSKVSYETTNVKVAIPSMLELIVPGTTQYDTFFLYYHHDLTRENANKETIDYVWEQNKSWLMYSRHDMLKPDNHHPNREAHLIAYKHLLEHGFIKN